MARAKSGARQPLAQQRPKRASDTARARTTSRANQPPKGAETTSRAAVKKTLAKPSRAKKPRQRAALSGDALRDHAHEVWSALHALYPDAHCELDYRSPWQLLVATILSAQCTDKRVNMVTPVLFARYATPQALADADPGDVEAIIKSTGFFRAKTKSILGAARAVTERFGGEVPASMEELVPLPGVGRKTANVVLGNAFGINTGVVVDTHVGRLSQRLGLTSETDPIKVERDLMAIFPQERWTLLSHLLIWHGRRVCDAKRPQCGACSLHPICPTSSI